MTRSLGTLGSSRSLGTLVEFEPEQREHEQKSTPLYLFFFGNEDRYNSLAGIAESHLSHGRFEAA